VAPSGVRFLVVLGVCLILHPRSNMLGLHLLCKDRINLTRGAEPGTWESGFWGVSKTDAASLVGGMLYLHQSKGVRSYFGGRISSFKEVETEGARSTKVVFGFVFEERGRDAPWLGAKAAMAVKGGVVNEE
jgi:hypothetical protein